MITPDNIIDSIKNGSSDHYLTISQAQKLPYFIAFERALPTFATVFKGNDFNKWATEKMLVSKKFDQKQFIQYAVEASAVRYFADNFKKEFTTEAKINPQNKKDVDIRFKLNGFVYNIEVKCPRFDEKENVESQQNVIKISTFGRVDDLQEEREFLVDIINEGLKKQGKTVKNGVLTKNMDNNLKDFLINANEKFNPSPADNEINLLLVGCGDAEDIQKWFDYLYAYEGLFTSESFCSQASYDNVDGVILTDQYYRHRNYNFQEILNYWTLQNCFNLILPNPYSKRKEVIKKGICGLISTMSNFTKEFAEFYSGFVKNDAFQSRVIPYFIRHLAKSNPNLMVLLNESDKQS